MTDFRVLCADMLAWAEKASAHYYQQPDVLVRARAALAESAAEGPTFEQLYDLAAEHEGEPVASMQAALARWGHQPAPPADGEVGELVEFLRIYGDEVMDEYGDVGEHDMLTRAADLLEQRQAAHD